MSATKYRKPKFDLIKRFYSEAFWNEKQIDTNYFQFDTFHWKATGYRCTKIYKLTYFFTLDYAFFLISIACPIDIGICVSWRVCFVHFTYHSNYITNCVLRLINIFVHQRVCRFVVLRLFPTPRRNNFFICCWNLRTLRKNKLVTLDEYLTIVFLRLTDSIRHPHSSSTFLNFSVPSAFTFAGCFHIYSAFTFFVGLHI